MATHAHTTRREVLKAMPAAGMATMIPIAASAAVDQVDPHQTWLAEWIALRDAYDGHELAEAEAERAYRRMVTVGRQITFHPCRNGRWRRGAARVRARGLRPAHLRQHC